MRRSIDDDQLPAPPVSEDDYDTSNLPAPMNWSVMICDDYDDMEIRVQLTLEEVGAPATGHVAHMSPDQARRLRRALRSALKEVGQDPGE